MTADQKQQQAGVSATLAFRIALRYGARIPLPQELIRDFKLTKATAYRYLAAMREASKPSPIRPEVTP